MAAAFWISSCIRRSRDPRADGNRCCFTRVRAAPDPRHDAKQHCRKEKRALGSLSFLDLAFALHSDSHSGWRFLDNPRCGGAKPALLPRICAHHRPIPGTHHQLHRGYRHSPDHVRRTGQLVPALCGIVSFDCRIDCHWRIDSRSTERLHPARWSRGPGIRSLWQRTRQPW